MISETVLVLAGPLGGRLDGERAGAALARGLEAEERLECDICALRTDLGTRSEDASKTLDGVDFDRRMRAARALVIVCSRLDDRTLAGSIAFEAATRARQSGVPAYAVAGHNALDPFEARIVDLQTVLQASTARALSVAGKELATIV